MTKASKDTLEITGVDTTQTNRTQMEMTQTETEIMGNCNKGVGNNNTGVGYNNNQETEINNDLHTTGVGNKQISNKDKQYNKDN